jgi:predicted DCC family thiol-disulfide oxidoreductase YuxK
MIVWYDKGCGICSAFVAWVNKVDPHVPIMFIDNTTREILPQMLSYHHFRSLASVTIIVETTTGQMLTHHHAIAAILSQLPGVSKLVSHILRLRLMNPVWILGYRLISRYRHHISKILGFQVCEI